jgi:hypothetical protein
VLNVTRDHFLRAASEIGQSGENDTLPYDIDAAFVRDKAEDLSQVYFGLFQLIDAKSVRDAAAFMNGLTIGSERLLVPSGSDGFRIATKIHPFWNLYLNGLGLAIADGKLLWQAGPTLLEKEPVVAENPPCTPSPVSDFITDHHSTSKS